MDSNCKLSKKTCVPCSKDILPLKGRELLKLHKQLGNCWQVIEEHHLEKEYLFPDFCKVLAFTNKVGAVSEQEGHHPDILLTYGKVKIQLWTHKIDGLSESDFVLAAKCDEVSGSKSKQEVIKSYFHGLELASYNDIIQLFASEAMVHSPLYGKIEAPKFYKELFSDTQGSKTTLKNIFVNPENDNTASAHFVYSWTLKDGTLVHFECVDVFEFVPQGDKIQFLTIIYDNYHTRAGFKKVHDS
jgi:4a-hydroxytetrahydrobiopterin dehydratase